MITIDELLIELENKGIAKLDSAMPARDKKILVSLTKQIKYGHFLTENQGKLLIKILTENKQFLVTIPNEQLNLLDSPEWSQPFRVIEQVRKVVLSKDHEHSILIEFTYNKRIRQLIYDLGKHLEGQLIALNAKQYSILLTEKNIFTLVKALQPQRFEIDSVLMRFYEEISEILKNNKSPFDIFSTTNEKILEKIKEEVGEVSEENLTMLNDRRFKFQYSIFPKNPENSLKNSIANRPSTRVWISSQEYSLDQLLSSLTELDRLPLLVVFNGHDSKECYQHLTKLQISLKNSQLDDNVGIYFRFDNNTDNNKKFNSSISEIEFNKNLTTDTKVVGIANNKLPKFIINHEWYPKTVITFSNNFRNNKTSFYCDSVDLIVYYNDKQPIVGGVDAIV
jgi:hypothetical protein